MPRKVLSVFTPQGLEASASYITKWLGELYNKLGSVEDWKEVDGSSGEPSFENSWTNIGGNYETAAFYKDPFGRVHLRGTISSGGSGLRAFTLPTQYRPNDILVFAVVNGANVDRITIDSNGYVTPLGSGQYSLDGISFRAEADANAVYYIR